MTHVRVYHTATLLHDGRVLIAGGADDNGVLKTAELFDPATGKFSRTGSMVQPRKYHTATLLPDGRVLIAGGIDARDRPSGILSSAELYDPATGTFRATGSMTHLRYGHTATLLPNGRVLIESGYAATAELYDPATGKFKATGSMTIPRLYYATAPLSNGRVLLAGGENLACVSLRATCNLYTLSAELYDPATGRFKATGSMARVRDSATATLLPTGRVLLAGGYDGHKTVASADLYDPATGTFKATGSMARVRLDQTATALLDGRVLIAGGVGSSAMILATAEIYNPLSGKFSPAGPMSVPRNAHTATTLLDGRVLITGGVNDNGGLASAEVWRP